jgi:DNA-binding CsgD family transcriptional regulator
MALLTAGATTGVISGQLGISRHTVRRHVANILAKLEVPSRRAAVALLLRSGELTGAVMPADRAVLAPRESPGVGRLTPRQYDVLQLVLSGASNRAIAERLCISLSTARWHVSNILGHLGARTRGEAVARAIGLSRPTGLERRQSQPAAAPR